jgi:hypothetical protein
MFNVQYSCTRKNCGFGYKHREISSKKTPILLDCSTIARIHGKQAKCCGWFPFLALRPLANNMTLRKVCVLVRHSPIPSAERGCWRVKYDLTNLFSIARLQYGWYRIYATLKSHIRQLFTVNRRIWTLHVFGPLKRGLFKWSLHRVGQ